MSNTLVAGPSYEDLICLVALDGIRAVADEEYNWGDYFRSIMELLAQQIQAAAAGGRAVSGSAAEMASLFEAAANSPEMAARFRSVEGLLGDAEAEVAGA